jgi:hypothetical protein
MPNHNEKGDCDGVQERNGLALPLNNLDFAGKFLLLRLTDHLLKMLVAASSIEHVIELVHDDLLLYCTAWR